MSTPQRAAALPGPERRATARASSPSSRAAGMISDQAELDDEPIEDVGAPDRGDALWERLWRPLLDSKFDGGYDDLPATYLWSRTRRTAGTRDRAGREVMGWIRGGHQAPRRRARRGASASAGARCSRTRRSATIVSSRRPRQGVVVGRRLPRPRLGGLHAAAAAHATAPAAGPRGGLPADPYRYLGVVCVVARVRRSVSPYYALNITDRRVAAHQRGRDHARGRPRARGRAPDLRAALRAPGLARAGAADSAEITRSTSPRCAACSLPSTRARRDREPGGPRPLRRARAPGRR